MEHARRVRHLQIQVTKFAVYECRLYISPSRSAEAVGTVGSKGSVCKESFASQMASFMDSTSVFEQRLKACDVPSEAIKALQDVGVTSLSKLAFCTSYAPSMPDDAPLVKFFKETIDPEGHGINAGTMSALRRAFFEAHTFMLNDLRTKIDKKDDEAPRKVPQAERNSRLQAQRKRLTGIEVSGPLEPSDSLVDVVSQQREDELLRYIELEQCTCRDSEVRASKNSKTNKADLTSDFGVRQAMQRRALAYDQLEIFTFQLLEGWHTYLFNLMAREAVAIDGVRYNKVSMSQILEADRQVFVLTSDRCRRGLQIDSAGRYPAQDAFELARMDPLVTSLLQPLPFRAQSKDEPRHKNPRVDTKGKATHGEVGGGRASGKGGRGRGGKQSSGSRGVAPKELIGLNLRTKKGEPLCFAYNINGCTNAEPGQRCSKGFHICARCLENHSKLGCTNPQV